MQIQNIALAFQTQGKPVHWQSFGQGHINQTLKVQTDTGNLYILQRINGYIFRQPEQLMENALAITTFLRKKGQKAGQVLHFIPTWEGQFLYIDDAGECWRMYDYIPGQSADHAESLEDFYRCGLAFGTFQMLLADFPAHTLHETIPNFHNTVERYAQFRASIGANASGRLAQVTTEVDFLLSLEDRAGTLQRMLEHGLLPLRVTHNDTKLNNLLFDDAGHPICILDLDTVMPGLSVMDFADAIRFGAATIPEDAPDWQNMTLDLDRFRAYARGFLEAAVTLTPTEVEMLPESVLIIALEQATRFLKDYLDGDVYYHIAYPEHNLVRARTQIQLAADVLQKMNEMNKIITEIYETIRKNRND